jgi:hypothetical protein
MRLAKRLTLITLSLLLFAISVFAADLRVTDNMNATMLVRGVVIDYGAFRDDKEDQGIRVQVGEALVTAEWANIETLNVTGRDENVNPPRIRVELALRNGQKMSGVLVSRGRMKLTGKTDVGDYSIDLSKIKTITPVRADGRR